MVPIQVDGADMVLDFYIFDVVLFDVFLGQPWSILALQGPCQEHFNAQIGGKEYSVPFVRALNYIAEQPPEPDLLDQARTSTLHELAQPDFEEDSEFFVEEEAETDEPFRLNESEKPSRPSIELKPLPEGLRYIFLKKDPETLVIISSKLSEEEVRRLTLVLEKHQSVFGYSLQDLKGISPNLCTHRIPLDPEIPPSREPQR